MVVIRGILGGPIWMPSRVCGKRFRVSNEEYPFGDPGNPPTLRDMVLRVTNDGDFQSCEIAEANVIFTQTKKTGTATVTKQRVMDIRQFPSVSDCVVELESERYFEILDCFLSEEE